jgi:hypothetical protein
MDRRLSVIFGEEQMIVLSISCRNNLWNVCWFQLDLQAYVPGLKGPEVKGTASVEESVAIYEPIRFQITRNFNLNFMRYKMKLKCYLTLILKIKWIYACNETNLMHYLSSLYWVTTPLHVSGLLVAHHQEIAKYICDNNTYQLSPCYLLMMGY